MMNDRPICETLLFLKLWSSFQSIHITQVKEPIFSINASLTNKLQQLIFIDAYIWWFFSCTNTGRTLHWSLTVHIILVIAAICEFVIEKVIRRHCRFRLLRIAETMFSFHVFIECRFGDHISTHMTFNVAFLHVFIHRLFWYFIRAIATFDVRHIWIHFSFDGRQFDVLGKFVCGMLTFFVCEKFGGRHHIIAYTAFDIHGAGWHFSICFLLLLLLYSVDAVKGWIRGIFDRNSLNFDWERPLTWK